MFAPISAFLFVVGIAGVLYGYVHSNEVVGVPGYVFTVAGVIGLSDVFRGKTHECY